MRARRGLTSSETERHHAQPLVLVAFALAGCAVGPSYTRAEPAAPPRWSRLETASAGERGDLGEWWRRLNDPLLSELVDQALRQSLDLRKAQARLREARARQAVAGAARYPSLEASASASRTDTLAGSGLAGGATVTGTSNDYFVAGNWELAAGRRFGEAEERAGKAVCVLGESVREKLFGRQSPVGSAVRLKGFSCEVIGLLRAKGQAAMGQDQDDTVVMPLRTVQRRLTGSQDIARITVTVKQGASMDAAKEQLTRLLRERRKIAENEDDDFRVMDMRQLAEMLTSTTRILTMLLGAVAAVSLLVGGIGIMNIMLVSVTERTREIGIRLAIGALEREVLLQFLIEAVTLSCLGGVVGITLATFASLALAGVMGVPYQFYSGINLLAFVFSAVIGVAFGYCPARRAAGLDPIDALRYE